MGSSPYERSNDARAMVDHARPAIAGYNQQEFAECLGVAGPTVCRWETGAQIQQRFHNDVMRAFFDVPQFRDYLARLHGVRSAGSVGSTGRPAKTA